MEGIYECFLGTAELDIEYSFDEECLLYVELLVFLATRWIFTPDLGHICKQL